MRRYVLLAALLIGSLAPSGLYAAGSAEGAATGRLKIALVVKNLGNSFFDAVRDGGVEAANEIGNVDVIYQGPSTPTAEGQIEIIDSLLAQKVNALAISADDVDALVPITKKAMKEGVKVISFDSAIAPSGRELHLAPSDDELIGRSQIQTIARMIGYRGEIAILSASSQATNQNVWIGWMKRELQDPKYSAMKLDAVVYGDDLSDESYRQAMGLFKSYPNLRGIVCPTTVGISATAKALEDTGLAGKIALTGLGLPSEMKQYIKDGTCTQMALWNPIDLGYTAVMIADDLIKGNIAEVAPGDVFEAGRMGVIRVGDGNVAVMSTPFVFDAGNIDKFASIY